MDKCNNLECVAPVTGAPKVTVSYAAVCSGANVKPVVEAVATAQPTRQVRFAQPASHQDAGHAMCASSTPLVAGDKSATSSLRRAARYVTMEQLLEAGVLGMEDGAGAFRLATACVPPPRVGEISWTADYSVSRFAPLAEPGLNLLLAEDPTVPDMMTHVPHEDRPYWKVHLALSASELARLASCSCEDCVKEDEEQYIITQRDCFTSRHVSMCLTRKSIREACRRLRDLRMDREWEALPTVLDECILSRPDFVPPFWHCRKMKWDNNDPKVMRYRLAMAMMKALRTNVEVLESTLKALTCRAIGSIEDQDPLDAIEREDIAQALTEGDVLPNWVVTSSRPAGCTVVACGTPAEKRAMTLMQKAENYRLIGAPTHFEICELVEGKYVARAVGDASIVNQCKHFATDLATMCCLFHSEIDAAFLREQEVVAVWPKEWVFKSTSQGCFEVLTEFLDAVKSKDRERALNAHATLTSLLEGKLVETEGAVAGKFVSDTKVKGEAAWKKLTSTMDAVAQSERFMNLLTAIKDEAAMVSAVAFNLLVVLGTICILMFLGFIDLGISRRRVAVTGVIVIAGVCASRISVDVIHALINWLLDRLDKRMDEMADWMSGVSSDSYYDPRAWLASGMMKCGWGDPTVNVTSPVIAKIRPSKVTVPTSIRGYLCGDEKSECTRGAIPLVISSQACMVKAPCIGWFRDAGIKWDEDEGTTDQFTIKLTNEFLDFCKYVIRENNPEVVARFSTIFGGYFSYVKVNDVIKASVCGYRILGPPTDIVPPCRVQLEEYDLKFKFSAPKTEGVVEKLAEVWDKVKSFVMPLMHACGIRITGFLHKTREVIGDFTGVSPDTMMMLSKWLCGFAFVRTAVELIRWVFEFFPVAAQHWVYSHTPSALSSHLLSSYGVHEWIDQTAKLLERKDKEEPNQALLEEIKAHVANGEMIYRGIWKMSWSRTFLVAVRELKSKADEYTASVAFDEQGKETFWVSISGEPCVGKSVMGSYLASYLTGSDANAWTADTQALYIRDSDDYWNNLTPRKTVCLIDDLWADTEQRNANMCANILAICNSLPFYPRGAFEKDKGQVANFHSMVTTSNFPCLNDVKGALNIAAVERRRNVNVWVRLRETFLRDDPEGGKMSPEKTMAAVKADMSPQGVADRLAVEKMEHIEICFVPRVTPRKDGHLVMRPTGAVNTDMSQYYQLDGKDAPSTMLLPEFLKYVLKAREIHSTMASGIAARRRVYVKNALDLVKLSRNEPIEEPKDGAPMPPIPIPPGAPIPAGESTFLSSACYWILSGGLLVALGGLFAIWYWNRSEPELESGTQRMRTITSKKEKEKATAQTEADVLKNEDPSERVFKQTAKISRPIAGDETVVMNCIAIDDRHVLLNTHYFLKKLKVKEDDLLTFTFPNLTLGTSYTFTERFSTTRLHYDLIEGYVSDVCVYDLNTSIPSCRNIRRRFAPDAVIRDLRPGAPLVRHALRTDCTAVSHTGEYMGTYDGKMGGDEDVCFYRPIEYKCSTLRSKGECGSAVMLDAHPECIIGIHTAYYAQRSICQPVSREWLDSLHPTAQFMELEAAVEKMPTFYPSMIAEGKAEPGDNMPMSGNTAGFYSVNVPHNPNCATAYRKTPAYGLYGEPVSAITRKLPQMVLEQEEKHLVIRHPVEEKYLKFGIVVAKRLLLVNTGVPTRLLTDDEVINGFDGAPGLDMTKSPGYPFVSRGQGRKDLYEKRDDGKWRMKRDFAKNYRVFEDLFLSGNTPPVIIAPDLKDSREKLEKILAGQIRTFEKLPMPYVQLIRKYYGAFCEHITRSFGRTPSAIGIDKCSREWDDLVKKAIRHLKGDTENPTTWDADYKNYEAIYGPEAARAAAQVANAWYDQGGRCEADNQARLELARATVTNWVVWRCNMWLKTRGMPSGVPVTAPLNTVYNLILLAGMYMKCAEEYGVKVTPADFCQQVNLILYGDDNVNDVAVESRPFYNFQTVRKALAGYNIQITPADKSKPIDEVGELFPALEREFLKAKTAWSPELRAYVPLVNWGKFKDSIYWCKGKSEEDFLNACNSFLQEVFFYGHKAAHTPGYPSFDVIRAKLAEVVPFGTRQALVSYDELLCRYGEILEPIRGRHLAPDDFEIVETEADVISVTDEAPVHSDGAVSTVQPPMMKHEETSLERWAMKEVQLAYITVSPAAAPNTGLQAWEIPSEVVKAQMNLIKANNVFWKGTLVMTFQMVSTGWKSGLAIAYFVPFARAATGRLDLKQSTALDHVLIDYSNNAACMLRVPFRHQVNFWTNFDPLSGTVFLDVFTSLVTQTGSASSAVIRVSVHWEDVEACLPNTNAIMAIAETEGAIVSSEAKGDTASPHTQAGGNVTQNIYNFSSDSFKAKGSLDQKASAAVSGKGSADNKTAYGQRAPEAGHDKVLDQPNTTVPPMYTRNGRLIRATVDGADFVEQTGDFAAIDIMPQPRDFDTDVDEMDIHYLISRMALLAQYSWPDAASPGTLLFTIPMTPFQVLKSLTYPATTVYLSPLEAISAMFRYWRGKLKFRIQVVAPKEFTGQMMLVLAYGYHGSAPTFSAATSLKHIDFDFSDTNREIFFDIDFLTAYDWLNSWFGPYMEAQCSIGKDQLQLGQVFVYSSAPIASPGGYTNAVSINLWMSSDAMEYRDNIPSIGLSPLSRALGVASLRAKKIAYGARKTKDLKAKVSSNSKNFAAGKTRPPFSALAETEAAIQSTDPQTQAEAQAAPTVNRTEVPVSRGRYYNLKQLWIKQAALGSVRTVLSSALPKQYLMKVDGPFDQQIVFNGDHTEAYETTSQSSRIADFYALWKGSVVYDINVKSTNAGWKGYLVVQMVAAQNFGEFLTDGIQEVTSALPNYAQITALLATLPARPTDLSVTQETDLTVRWPMHRSTPPSMVVIAAPGTTRISTSWMSPLKSLGVVSATPSTAVSKYGGVLVMTLAGDAIEGGADIDINVFAQPGDHARAGVFSGIPPVCLQHVTLQLDGVTPSTTYTSFVGDYYEPTVA